MALTRLAPAPSAMAPTEAPPTDHPMRRVTRQVAVDPGAWTGAERAEVAAYFDGLAGEWHTRNDRPDRNAPLEDAYARGGVPAGGRCLELGSGTGLITPWFVDHHAAVVADEIAMAMLAIAPADLAPRVLGDGARLPFPAAAFDVVALVNAFLFAPELERVVAPSGVVVWVNSRGPVTPIHLPAEEALAAMGDGWDGVASEAGSGTWAVLRRR